MCFLRSLSGWTVIRAIGAILVTAVPAGAQDSLLIQGVKYRTDTLIHTHDVGLGTLHTYYRLPDLPLLINVLDIDAQNPHIRFETCLGRDSLIGTERPTAMALRNSRAGHLAFAAINGDFYNTVSPNTGTPVNGQILAGQVAKVPHNSRPVVAFDDANSPFIDVMTFTGYARYGTQEYRIADVNGTRNTDDLILFNSWFGTMTRTNQWGTEVVLSLREGSWGTNKTMKMEVLKVIKGTGSSLIPQDQVILSGHGKAATFLEGLHPGDSLELDIQIGQKNFPSLSPKLMEMVGGDRLILKNHVVLETNWPELHPRTAVGFSSDRSRVILLVVDGRTDQSKGVSTKQLADIMRASGASDALNLDGGGSSVMVVRNKIRNSPSDGSERAVGNALLVISTALPGSEKSMQLNVNHLTIPYGKKFQVLGSTYDAAGEVVNYLAAKNILYAVSGDIGKIDHSGLFTASGTGGSGWITGTWNGTTDSVSVVVKPAGGIKFSVKSLVTDNRRDYVFKVFGSDLDGNTYLLDNDIVKFTPLDETVGAVSGAGLFHGLAGGTTPVVVATNDGKTDTCWVHVEIGEGYLLLDDFSDLSSWSSTLSYIDKVTLSRQFHSDIQKELTKVEYSFTYSNRTASITLSKNLDVFGLPDSIMMEAAGSGYKSSFYYLLDHPNGLCQVPAFYSSDLLKHQAAIRVADIKQEDYPLTFSSIRLIVERDPSYVNGTKYNGTFWLKGLYAVYPARDVNNRIQLMHLNDRFLVWPNPAREGVFLRSTGNEAGLVTFCLYDQTGQRVVTKDLHLPGNSDSVFISLQGLPPGLYIYELSGGGIAGKGKIALVR